MRGAFLIGSLVVALVVGMLAMKRMNGHASAKGPAAAAAVAAGAPRNVKEVQQLEEQLQKQAKEHAARAERLLQQPD
jgi:hypothetical protein